MDYLFITTKHANTYDPSGNLVLILKGLLICSNQTLRENTTYDPIGVASPSINSSINIWILRIQFDGAFCLLILKGLHVYSNPRWWLIRPTRAIGVLIQKELHVITTKHFKYLRLPRTIWTLILKGLHVYSNQTFSENTTYDPIGVVQPFHTITYKHLNPSDSVWWRILHFNPEGITYL